jgi:hypothetical protein
MTMAKNILWGCAVKTLTAALSPIADARCPEFASDAVDGLQRLCLPTTGARTLFCCAYSCPEMSAEGRESVLEEAAALLRFDGAPAQETPPALAGHAATALFKNRETLLLPDGAESQTIALARSKESMWASLSPEATAQRAAPTAVGNDPPAARGAGPPPPPPQALLPGITCPGISAGDLCY